MTFDDPLEEYDVLVSYEADISIQAVPKKGFFSPPAHDEFTPQVWAVYASGRRVLEAEMLPRLERKQAVREAKRAAKELNKLRKKR